MENKDLLKDLHEDEKTETQQIHMMPMTSKQADGKFKVKFDESMQKNH